MAAVLERTDTGSGEGASPALALALVASLLLHALLLQVLGAVHRPQPTEEPARGALQLRIVMPPAAAPARQATPAAAAPPRAPSVARPRVVARPHPRTRAAHRRRVRKAPAERRARAAKPRSPAPPRPIAVAAPLLAPPRPSPLPRFSVAAPSDAFAPAAPRAVAAAEAAKPPSAAGTGRAGAAADERAALAQYRRAVMAQAQRLGRYPRLALDNDWQGEARVHMVVGAQGKLAALAIGRGSGYAVLDRQALRMVRRAEPLAPIPRVLRGRQFTVEIPVIFRLREPS